jgi:hypothetical protein
MKQGGLTMKVSLLARLSAAGVAIAALTAATDASAHYYAVLRSPNIQLSADGGMFTDIRTDILHSTCNAFERDFVTHEMWYGVDGGATHWVEVGFMDGAATWPNCVTTADFWADYTAANGLAEHFPGNGWSFGSTYGAEIVANTTLNCAWDVWLGGLLLGTSTNNCAGSGRLLAAGIESTSQTTGSARGFLTNWEEFNGFFWARGWDGQMLHSDAQPFIKWITTNVETEETLNE